MSVTATAKTGVLLAPYLKLHERMTAGRWEIIPAPKLMLADTTGQHAYEQARGLLELFHHSRRSPSDFGCFFRRGNALVGAAFRHQEIFALRRALIVALIDRKPSPTDLNAGHAAWTSDNADLYGYAIGADGYVSAQYGAMNRTLSLGIRIGEPELEISPPIEVVFPTMARDPDSVVVEGVFGLLTAGGADARRLSRAIDWFDLAWRNTPSTNQDMRLLMLKSGFETLLDVGDRLDRQRTALDLLLERTRGRNRIRHYTTLRGEQRTESMSDLAWWYTRFTFLRNAIAHSDLIRPGLYRFGRDWHLWIAEARLREAIKEFVALRGYQEVRLSESERIMQQAIEMILAGT